jgi:Domain of unknown function (DUF4259)
MGAWGVGPFENDDALDFLADLSELPAEALGRRLSAALDLGEGYLEVPQASAAVAAAALIAAARGAAYGNLDDEVMALARSGRVRDDARLRDMALTALARVNSATSEWRELWSESDSAAEADVMIVHLRSALA